MPLTKLVEKTELENNPKAKSAFLQFNTLLAELGKKDLPKDVLDFLNSETEAVNAHKGSLTEFSGQLRKAQTKVLKRMEKDLKLVPKGYYRNLWMILGMTSFGLPMGVAFGLNLGNMALIGLGLPIGMAMGIAVGSGMDKKAFNEGRQLDIQIEF